MIMIYRTSTKVEYRSQTCLLKPKPRGKIHWALNSSFMKLSLVKCEDNVAPRVQIRGRGVWSRRSRRVGRSNPVDSSSCERQAVCLHALPCPYQVVPSQAIRVTL
jgi:hypothetical protein